MSTATATTLREQRAAEVAALLAEGLNGVQIADRLGLSRAYTYALIHDPDGSKDKLRKRAYGRPCIDCGEQTSGSDGHRNAPLRCDSCHRRHIHESAFWSRDRIIEAIQEWADRFGTPPTAPKWNVAASGHDSARWKAGTWPHLSYVQRIFGSWANAIEAAGFPRPLPKGRPPGAVTDEERREALRLYELHGATRAAGIVGITTSGLYQRIRPLLPKGSVMPTYNATTAIDRDIEKVSDRIKALEAEIEERKVYLKALEAAKKALNGSHV